MEFPIQFVALSPASEGPRIPGSLTGENVLIRLSSKYRSVSELAGRDVHEAIMLEGNNRQQRGVFGPAELDLFERVLAKLGCDHLGEAARSSMAQRVMANYMAGICDEEELAVTSRQPLGR